METKESLDIYFFLFAGTVVILLFAVAIIVFFLVYRKRIFEKELQFQKRESDHRLELLKNTIQITERERKRIAGDLHDEIGSHLSAIRMSFHAIKTKADNQQEVLQIADESKAVVDETIESVRSISHNLLPPGLEKFGLINTVNDLFHRLGQHSQIQMEFISEPDIKLGHAIELPVYRVLQELLNNSLKHAAPTLIRAEFKKQNDAIILKFIDNGKGFDLNRTQFNNGLGLKNIDSRIMVLQGKCVFQTEPGKGVNVEIVIPQ